MEDGLSTADAGESAIPRAPPPPPSPTDAESASITPLYSENSDEPLNLEKEQWDITKISALAAMRMLTRALETLAEATGDVPPTPPVSRPTTPSREEERRLDLRRISSPEVCIGSPEAHPQEPITTMIGNDAPDISVQDAAIARRFFSKTVPAFSLQEYLVRLHRFCAHSPGVYLAAANFCYRLCVAELKVPATSRTIHRLALASIRVAAKAVEDHKWKQDKMSKVGGVSKMQLMHLEVALCYLLDFDLWVNDKMLASGMYLLQQAANQGAGSRRLAESFKLKLPLRRQLALAKS
jgi:hypothetical protein